MAKKKIPFKAWLKWYKELKKWYDTYFGAKPEPQPLEKPVPPPPPPPPGNPPA